MSNVARSLFNQDMVFLCWQDLSQTFWYLNIDSPLVNHEIVLLECLDLLTLNVERQSFDLDLEDIILIERQEVSQTFDAKCNKMF